MKLLHQGAMQGGQGLLQPTKKQKTGMNVEDLGSTVMNQMFAEFLQQSPAEKKVHTNFKLGFLDVVIINHLVQQNCFSKDYNKIVKK